MLKTMQTALIRKDLRSVTSNRNLFIMMLVLPFMMAVVIPSVFVLIVGLSDMDSPEMQDLLRLLPEEAVQSDTRSFLTQMLLNDMIPIFFLVIPAMTASIIAASSFIGEKEKRTLETLLYCPLSIRQIFSAKIFASFALSQLVSLVSFVIMVIVVQTELWFISRSFIPLGINWLVLLFLLAPGLSLVAITLMVSSSAKAKSVEEANQRSAFLVLPIIILAAGQFSGLTASLWLLIGSGVVCAVIGIILLRRVSASFDYEKLLL